VTEYIHNLIYVFPQTGGVEAAVRGYQTIKYQLLPSQQNNTQMGQFIAVISCIILTN